LAFSSGTDQECAMAATPCPGLDDYQRLLRGLLPSRQVTSLTEHLEHCEPCLEAVRQLSADDSLQEVLPEARAAELPGGALVEGLIQRVCRLRSAGAHTPPPAGDTSEPYDFLAPPEGADEIGRLGGYRVLKVLGAGGMGIVFQAEDVQLRRPVALKVMKPALAARAVDRQRFLREAQAAAAVRHDHIVTIYQVGQDRDVPFLAMERLEGETLEARLQREGKVPPAEVVRVGREIAVGLAAAHERGLIHRDIKPSNVWLEAREGEAPAEPPFLGSAGASPFLGSAGASPSRPGGRVKILDFGLARPASPEARLTVFGAIAGTPEYMAPEQARGGEVDHRCDLFSLGCVLYRLAAGEPPFPGTDALAVLRAVAVHNPPPPRKVNPAVPAPVSALIMQLLAKNRDERPASTRAVVQALEALAGPPAVKAPGPPRPRRGWLRWALVPAAAALLAALGLVGYHFFPGLVPPSASVSAPAGPPLQPTGDAPESQGKPPAEENVVTSKPTPPPPPPEDTPGDLARKATAVLRAHCHRCHGEDGAIEGGFNYVLDLSRLVSRKKVVPGDAAESKLYRRLVSRDDPMPPTAEKVRPSKDDVDAIRKWIEAGAPAEGSRPAPRPWLSEAAVLECIRRDLADMNPRARPFARYFTIAHLYNAGLSEDELQTYRHGLARLINSLSWERRIAVPQPIDPQQTVFRIDLRNYHWGKKQWEQIVALYPYGVTYPTADARACYTATGCWVPYVRADWFVATAARPPLYHDLLQLPETAGELEKRLGVDVAEDIRQDWVARAAFSNSGVALHSRLLERHEAAYGAYWKSYDFGSDTGRKNVRAHPLGPGPDDNSFQHDGGEIIFNLPNGLQAYLLVDAQGNRIDKGPIQLVVDKKRRDAEVVNGISCMACHVQGTIAKEDQVREHVLKNSAAAFPRATQDAILALYPPGQRFAALLKEDAERFRAAVVQTGGRLAGTDPVVALAGRYEGDLDLNLAAAEVGMKPQAFGQALPDHPALAQTFGVLNVKDGTVPRQVLIEGFAALVGELRGGHFYDPREEEIRNSIGMQLRRIPKGEFVMGSPEAERGREEQELPHRVKISRPFYMGMFEVTQEEYEKVTGKNPSHFRGGGPGADALQGLDPKRFPVESVSWQDAQDFCDKLSHLPEEERAGRMYRLPTEAEWEYACRGGESASLPFNVGPSLSSDQANFDGDYPDGDDARPGPNLKRTTAVGSYSEPNGYGLYDMHGNVAEWCADYYRADYYARSPGQDPTGPAAGDSSLRVLRGGSWMDPARNCRTAARNSSIIRAKEYGFRVVCTVSGKTP
jgi:formylglycine-generating enzyme required for sulfatase activity/serine/threonine protein kinase